MAINICTHEQDANQIERAVFLDENHTIEEVLKEAAGKFDERHKVVKVLNENGDVVTFWYNDRTLEAALKECDCMLQYDVVEIPVDMIREKYVCFVKVNECSIRYASLIQKRTDKISLFKKEDVVRYRLPYQSCESIEDREAILYLQDDFSVFNSIGIYNEQCNLLNNVRKLREQGTRILVVDVPTIEGISRQLTTDELFRINNQVTGFAVPRESGDEIEIQLKKVYGEENYILYRQRKIANLRQYYRGNECVLEDLESEFSNVVGGLRVTTDAPNHYSNLVNFLGPCIVGGMYCKDSETIPSVIQRMLNDKYSEEYLVINYGTCGFYRSYMEKLDNLLIKRGDLIVIIDFFSHVKKHQGELYQQIDIDLTELYNKVQKNFFFESPVHMGAKGNQAVAEYIYPYIAHMRDDTEQREEIIKSVSIRRAGTYTNINLQFYQDEAEKLDKKYALSGKYNGAIVMNCNPFTNGHKYLIDVASKQVDYLIVFVVEEDKSYFTFRDRKKMVELGIKEFDNVIVLSSGNLVLSNLTMPEYFNKNNLQETVVNPTRDVEIFAKDIAPIFHISHRFIGEEPIDRVTAQYNRSIKQICQLYGIKVTEIPRAKSVGGGVISASKVRELMKRNCFEEIKEMVPESTWRYLELLKERIL